MGLSDNLRINSKVLPSITEEEREKLKDKIWNTKDLEAYDFSYRVDDDGQLWVTGWNFEPNPDYDENAPVAEGLVGHFQKLRNSLLTVTYPEIKCTYSGSVNFYTYPEDYEFTALFQNGILHSIIRTDESI